MEPTVPRPGAYSRWIVAGVSFAALSGLAWLLLGRDPHVRLDATRQGADVVFHIRTRNVNGLLHVVVFDRESRQTLWSVNLNYFPGPDLVYGRVPAPFTTFNGNAGTARQEFPRAGVAPRPLLPGKELLVDVHYQYDQGLSACAGSRMFSVTPEENGAVRARDVELPPGWTPLQEPGR